MNDAINYLEDYKLKLEAKAKELESKNFHLDAMMHWCNYNSIDFAISILNAGNKQGT